MPHSSPAIASAMGRLLPDGPSRLLQRVRLQFLMMTLLAGVIALVDMSRIQTMASTPAYLASVAGLAAWGVAMYLVAERGPWLDALGPMLVAGIGISAGYYDWAFPAMYAALFLHGTYGGGRRTAAAATMYVIAYESAMILTAPAEVGVEALFSHAVGVFVVAYLIRTIATSVRRHDRTRRREQILTRAGARLLTVSDPAGVAEIALAAVVSVIGGADRPHRVSLWRRCGEVLEMTAIAGPPLSVRALPLAVLPQQLRDAYHAGTVVRLGPARMAALDRSMGIDVDEGFRHGLSVPLLEGEQLKGLLFVATATAVDPDTVVALERFMHEVSLADVLVRRQALLSGVVDNSADAILLVGRDGVVEFASTSVAQLTGRDAWAIVGQPVGALLVHHPDGQPVEVAHLGDGLTSTCQLQGGDGAREVELAVSTLKGDAVVVNLRDVTDRRRLDEEVTYRAFHDPITGLANRALFNDRVEHARARVQRSGGRVAVVLIDLDDFKAVNDVHGHSAGDDLLVETARRLTTVLRAGDTCARFGGDEFAVLMEQVEDEAEISAVLDRVVEALRQPFTVGQRHAFVSASVGLRVGDASQPAEELIADADVAMYVAKAQGKNHVVRFADHMRVEATERLQLKSELLAAIEGGQLLLHYQPIVDLQSGEVTSFEALVRWQHPERGLMAPDVFIPVAEETGAIVPLGLWVLRQACTQLAAWRAAGTVRPNARMSVNLTSNQLLAPRLVEEVTAILEETGVPPKQLILEVTETALLGDPERAGTVLAAATDLGIAVAIDDFGTGYSSFAYLQRFPIEAIKVDRSFIARVAQGPEQAALAHAMLTLAQALQLATIAEGVEGVEQEQLLSGWGYSHGQGWHWARAMSVEDTSTWLTDRRDADGRTQAATPRAS